MAHVPMRATAALARAGAAPGDVACSAARALCSAACSTWHAQWSSSTDSARRGALSAGGPHVGPSGAAGGTCPDAAPGGPPSVALWSVLRRPLGMRCEQQPQRDNDPRTWAHHRPYSSGASSGTPLSGIAGGDGGGGAGGGGDGGNGSDHTSGSSSSDGSSSGGTLGAIQPRVAMVFTCAKCNTRSTKTFSRVSYTRGVVLVRCPGCQKLHLIADHLGWFGPEPFMVHKFVAAQGGNAVRIWTDDDHQEGAKVSSSSAPGLAAAAGGSGAADPGVASRTAAAAAAATAAEGGVFELGTALQILAALSEAQGMSRNGSDDSGGNGGGQG